MAQGFKQRDFYGDVGFFAAAGIVLHPDSFDCRFGVFADI